MPSSVRGLARKTLSDFTTIRNVTPSVSLLGASFRLYHRFQFVMTTKRPTKRSSAAQPSEPLQTTVVPPWSPLKDPLGHDLPYYSSTRPFPPPIPLLGTTFTGRLRAAGNRPDYQVPRYIPFEAPARGIVDRDSVVRRPIDEAGGGMMTGKSPGDLMRAYYRRPSWIWAVVGVVGVFVGGARQLTNGVGEH